MTNRRGFLKAIIGAILGPAAARFVSWRPEGRSSIFEEINLVTLQEIGSSALADNFFTTSPLLTRLRETGPMTFHGGGTSLKIPYDYEVFNIHAPSSQEVAWLG